MDYLRVVVRGIATENKVQFGRRGETQDNTVWLEQRVGSKIF